MLSDRAEVSAYTTAQVSYSQVRCLTGWLPGDDPSHGVLVVVSGNQQAGLFPRRAVETATYTGKWSRRPDLNRRPPASKAGTLPTGLLLDEKMVGPVGFEPTMLTCVRSG